MQSFVIAPFRILKLLSENCSAADKSSAESGVTVTDKGQKRRTSFESSNYCKQKKSRKARTAFTDPQLQTLEKSFEHQQYLSVQDRVELAAKLNLSDTQVKTWYQNRR